MLELLKLKRFNVSSLKPENHDLSKKHNIKLLYLKHEPRCICGILQCVSTCMFVNPVTSVKGTTCIILVYLLLCDVNR